MGRNFEAPADMARFISLVVPRAEKIITGVFFRVSFALIMGQNLVSVHVFHAEVQHYQVRANRLHFADRIQAVLRFLHAVAVQPQ